jgi:mono/diheme cytochrome c family protein
MFKRIVNGLQLLALAGAVAFVVMLFANEPGSSGSAAARTPGAQVFVANCARCHGADGGGGLGPQLSGGAVRRDFADPNDEVGVVTNGRAGMPAFGRVLSPEQIRQVVEYTRTL